MKIRHFSYNAFLIEENGMKIAVDPGLDLRIGKLNTLIPRSEWSGVTHILITHADPDHYWYADRMARVSNAQVVCSKQLVRTDGTNTFLLNPRKRKIVYSTKMERVHALDAGETINLDGLKIKGLKAVHGPVAANFLFGLLRREFFPGPGERVGMGALGFRIEAGGVVLANLGDTLLQKEWEGLEPERKAEPSA